MDEAVVFIVFKGSSFEFLVDPRRTTVGDLGIQVATKTDVLFETVKLTVPGRKLLKVAQEADSSLENAGIKPGAKMLLIGSTHAEVEAVRNSRDLPGLAGFDHELRVQASRRRQSSAAVPVKLPSGPYTFGSYEAWQMPGLTPPPSEALKLLHRLAADPGIVGILTKHRWTVGKLSEMPPEGKVGVSPVCILGVNINAGQEISLRLRTDDLKGFRRYQSIRQTLCHELAHIVFSEHDSNFKQLNSQLCKECEQLSSSLGVRMFQTAAEGWQLDVSPQPFDVMGLTAASSGRTLRHLAGDAQLPAAGQLPKNFTWSPEEEEQLESETLRIEAIGHHDAVTEAKELAAEALADWPRETTAAAIVLERDMETEPSGPRESSAEVETVAPPASIANGSASPQQLPETPEEAGTASASPARPDDAHVSTSNSGPSEDASTSYFRNAQEAVSKLVSSAGKQDAATALQTLATILKNALHAPGEPKYRRVRQQNAAFHARAGRHPGCLELLRAAGFVPAVEGQEEVLRLSRNDPGLLWISLSACEVALQSVMAQ